MQRGFVESGLKKDDVQDLQRMAQCARADVLRMTTTAGSGHPGGSLSSMDCYILLLAGVRVDPDNPCNPSRDRIVISHGHTAAGFYAALANTGFLSRDEVVVSFRRCGSIFEGHPSIDVPGVDWAGGNLGQGLSVACGMALATRYTKRLYRVYVVLGDGEHQKGQIAEAQRFAAKYRLSNLTAIVDCNGLQATGAVDDVMPQNLAAEYEAHGWRVFHADGHDFLSLYAALYNCQNTDSPTVILAHTIMGKGVPEIENDYRYHGTVLTKEQCDQALITLGSHSLVGQEFTPATRPQAHSLPFLETTLSPGTPRTYAPDQCIENRSACGNALADVAAANPNAPIVALDCDLGPSVKLDGFQSLTPDRFIQCGISEHHAASLAGGLSIAGALPVFADFAVFAIAETYNQQRFNDVNHTSVKLLATHCGLDVGEDGKTHQCIDYIGLIANLYGWGLIVPADANQADRAARWALTTPGNIAIAVGRSKLPVITDAQNQAVYGGGYTFKYGQADWLRIGSDATIVTCGSLTHRAVSVADRLAAENIHVGVLNMTCPLSLDEGALRTAAATGAILSYEDHHIRTGLGALVAACLAEAGLTCRFRRMGVTRYGGSGSPDDLYRDQGLDEDSLACTVRVIVEGKE